MTTVRICHLYPENMNIYGDRGNISVLIKRLEWRGHSAIVSRIGIGEEFLPGDFDLCYLGGGQDRDQNIIASDLAKKAAGIRSAAADGVAFLWVCGGIQLAGHEYTDSYGTTLPGVGILDLETVAGEERLIGDVVLDANIGDASFSIVGYENHIGRTYLGPEARPLGTVVKGFGNNGTSGDEGAVQQRVIGTYLHGPLLPKNPILADELLIWSLEHRSSGEVSLDPLGDDFTEAAQARAIERAHAKR